MENKIETDLFGKESIWKLIFKLAPPVMFAQLIQSLYNIVDSFFVGKFSADGVTALSVVYPVQLIICALGIGMGVGVNAIMAGLYALGRGHRAEKTAGAGTVLAVFGWIVFSVVTIIFMEPYAKISSETDTVYSYSVTYGNVVCLGSFGIFLESVWTKVHQAKGNMKTPMVAQIVGAVANIILDPIFIFGIDGVFEPMGISGAALATVIGQTLAAFVVFRGGVYAPPSFKVLFLYAKRIYKMGVPNMIMQALYTVYIVGLNLILVGFSDKAVAVLGIYYKLQSFFFIPLLALQICIVPVLSYNYSIGQVGRCKELLKKSIIMSAVLMIVGIFSFEFFPEELIGIFVNDLETFDIGKTAFRIIAISFLPAILSLIFPYFFQAIGKGKESIILTVLRQVVLFVPLAFVFSNFGLDFIWLTFPITEIITSSLGIYFFKKIPNNLTKQG